MTHPLYKNRISSIKKELKQVNPIINSTDDYFYVRNILESKMRILKNKNINFQMIQYKIIAMH